jgi:hypothetical protein
MHPLLKRILLRGTFVIVATIGVALGLRRALEIFLNANEATKITPGDNFGLQGPIVFGLAGFLMYAVMEWISYARDKARAARKNATLLSGEISKLSLAADTVDYAEQSKI